MSMMSPWMYDLFFYPRIPTTCEKPPTVYALLNSIVNFGKDEQTKIKDLARAGRGTIFDFNYPLSTKIKKDDFECMVLNHFLMRRIGFETLTAFKIQLDVKLNEIMPLYNKMFDSLENWDIFTDGEKTVRDGTDDRKTNQDMTSDNTLTNNSTTSNTETYDKRHSDTPQNKLDDVKNGQYISDYEYNTTKNDGSDNSTSSGTSMSNTNGTDNNISHEEITRTPADKMNLYMQLQTNLKNIYTMIFNDLEELFYQLY